MGVMMMMLRFRWLASALHAMSVIKEEFWGLELNDDHEREERKR
jgi:hypothetical protein